MVLHAGLLAEPTGPIKVPSAAAHPRPCRNGGTTTSRVAIACRTGAAPVAGAVTTTTARLTRTI